MSSLLGKQLHAAYNAPRKDQPELLAAAAVTIVDMRAGITGTDGRTDWTGRSWEYRQAMGQALGEANVPPEDRVRFLNALRYHVANELRLRLDADTLAEHGMRPLDALQRSRETRDKLRAERVAARKMKTLGVLSKSKRPRDKEALRAQLLKMLADLDASN